MNYQYHNSIISVVVVFFLSLAVCLRLSFMANIGVFVLCLGAITLIALYILDINAMSDENTDVIERNKKLKMATKDTAKIHTIALAGSTLLVASRGKFFFLVAALMAATLLCAWVWRTEVLKLQEVPNDHG
jgi:hypothetical protein